MRRRQGSWQGILNLCIGYVHCATWKGITVDRAAQLRARRMFVTATICPTTFDVILACIQVVNHLRWDYNWIHRVCTHNLGLSRAIHPWSWFVYNRKYMYQLAWEWWILSVKGFLTCHLYIVTARNLYLDQTVERNGLLLAFSRCVFISKRTMGLW